MLLSSKHVKYKHIVYEHIRHNQIFWLDLRTKREAPGRNDVSKDVFPMIRRRSDIVRGFVMPGCEA